MEHGKCKMENGNVKWELEVKMDNEKCKNGNMKI